MMTKVTERLMRDSYNAHTCLGCGHPCEDPYSFCGRCISASRYVPLLPERPNLRPIWKSIVFWLTFLGLLAAAWYGMAWIVVRKW
jgi:hypothetical protein